MTPVMGLFSPRLGLFLLSCFEAGVLEADCTMLASSSSAFLHHEYCPFLFLTIILVFSCIIFQNYTLAFFLILFA